LELSLIHASEERSDGRFHERIRACRLAQVMSQQEVADLAHISVRTLQGWESGRSVPYPSAALRRVAALYRVPARFLLHGYPEEH